MGRVRHNPKSEDYLKNSKYVVEQKDIKDIVKKQKGEVFLEVGHGKGIFLIENSYQNSENIYIGIEKYKTIQHVAVEKYEKKINELNLSNNNLFFVSGDVNDLEEIFDNNTVDKIYINFPDPWPKDRHSKRRLVDKGFLKKYYYALKKGGKIEFRTDQRDLYEYFLLQLEEINSNKNFGINLKMIDSSENLHETHKIDIKTEYEQKFINKGNDIYFIKCQTY